MAGATVRLLLADDHPVVRAGLRAVLDAEPDFEIVAEAATAEAAVERAAVVGPSGVDVVLRLVRDGLSNQRISRELFLSQATVKSHLVHIYAKLGVDSRTAAVAASTSRGLIRNAP
ncbi:hypothetical protein DMA15_31110 [Streptomyces sp. WAC 01529]|uniref:response regulator transcription factor n=1 Tax=Streptomyces sp. WAC 01529 TaxID=2203205 RepID=UPI000F717414|nr:LuxR C-terminal-related transcriptional regulator [Streptomyces sp. WAC 01529]AZM56484.1 hypothetical protein DMA15_31110 [Streptomyces sp. WAC 01529]